ncbi:uncharacterized protein LOC122082208 [Macadamia integrifolia]|uniref:uncharacterized protein LOC122082208 n=1 Tax=Macadamia integrifolia TaxID=60698 RepID=UPI001C4ED51A|nr:uncharacterized protein LOC122082208 [Macadamia integrifolia]
MSRLLSLYKSLSDAELDKLREEIMKSEGVSYLNSKDEAFLFNLACAERIEDLDRCAMAVARLGKKCSDPALCSFEDVYSDLKFGAINIGKLDFSSKEIDKSIDKMEKLISATSSLYFELQALSELELVNRKLKQLRHNTGNSEFSDQKFAAQRHVVEHYKEVSLWSQTFNKAVGLMARTICIIYARICVVFGPYISVLPQVSAGNVRSRSGQSQNQSSRNRPLSDSKSGPLGKPAKRTLIRFLSRESNDSILEDARIGFGFGFGIGFQENHYYLFGVNGKKNKLIQVAPPSTLGGSGLALRYANVILLVERYLNSPCSIGDDERESFYQMLPTSLKTSVRSKLRNRWKRNGEGGESGSSGDESLAEGWRDALKGIMEWLAPMAHDTVRWQAERNFERQNFEGKPTVLLLQTLHFSDREKTEAAIAEILVGVSCIFKYENRCFSSSSSGSDDEFR